MKDFIEGEVWKDVVGYEEFYEVSNYGRVYNKTRKIPFRDKFYYRPGKMKLLSINGNYNLMVLNKGRAQKSVYVHRIVAMAFVPNPHNKGYVDHIDGNPLNNKAENLRWCTNRENVNYDNVRRVSKTGITGVLETKSNNYITRIIYKRKPYASKQFKTIEEAIEDKEHKLTFINAYEEAIRMNIL